MGHWLRPETEQAKPTAAVSGRIADPMPRQSERDSVKADNHSALGSVTATCYPRGDTMPGVKSVLVLRPWLSKCDLGLSDPRQWLIAASVRRHGCRGF